jgi:hypothetical protein
MRAMENPDRNQWGFLLEKKIHEKENPRYNIIKYCPFKFIEWVSKQPEKFNIPDPLKIMICLEQDCEESYCWLDEVIDRRGPLISPYEYYKSIPHWDMCTCVALLDGINPMFVTGVDRNHDIAERFSKNGWELFNFLEKSAKSGFLKCIDHAKKDRPEDWDNLFIPSEVLSYVDSFNIQIPEPLKEMINSNEDKQSRISGGNNYKLVSEKEPQSSKRNKAENDNSNNTFQIDMENAKLSEELKIALHAWNVLYNSEGSFNPKLGHIDNIKTWIEKNYPNLPEAGKMRIAKVININKKGGATAINQ